jgi:hypothetical protein
MNTHPTFQPGKPLRLLDLFLRALRIILILGSVLAVPLLVLAITGRGTISVNGTIDAPFTVEFNDGSRIGVNGDGLSYENFEIGREHQTLANAPSVEGTVNLQGDDRDSRLIVVAMASLWLAAAWIGLVNFRGIIDSALRGEWLPAENPSRLRKLAAAILAYGVTGLTGQWLLNTTLDTVLPFEVSIAMSTWVFSLIVGTTVLALAEPFAEAARLREFEESAI